MAKMYDAVELRAFAETFLTDPILKMAVNSVLRNAPAVEVVRCKDCRHCYKATFSSTGYRCKVWGVYDTDCEVTPEHFCSYGERKDNGK